MNWSLGSRLPHRDGGALLDLRALNRIRDVNVAQHYAIIEPGVAQRQLVDQLRADGLPLVLNVTGSSPESGVVGNVLERRPAKVL
jgi:4-cresol dehydrogenase (hydroxylating)